MTQDASEVRVAAQGQIYVAPEATVLPANVTAALAAGFSSALGYVSEDGVTFTKGATTETIGAWQSFYPLRVITTEQVFTIAFALRQWNRDTISLAFGGGTFTDQGGGKTKYTPPAPSVIDVRALVIDAQDGLIHDRWTVSRAMVSDNVETQFTRTAAADLSITMSVLAPSGSQQPWEFMTDDPGVAS